MAARPCPLPADTCRRADRLRGARPTTTRPPTSDPAAGRPSLFRRLFDKHFPLIRLWHEKVKGNDWYSEITPELWLGGAPVSAADYARLVDSGITAVVNIRAEREDDTRFYEDHGITHVQVRVPDVTVPDGVAISAGVDWIRDAIDDGRVVLVHCAKGRGRSATLVEAYLMRQHGRTFDEAAALLSSKRRLTKLEARHRLAVEAWLETQGAPGAPRQMAGGTRRPAGDGR